MVCFPERVSVSLRPLVPQARAFFDGESNQRQKQKVVVSVSLVLSLSTLIILGEL